MSAERIYRLLLHAYPREFRTAYGREMVLLFRDQCRDGDVRSLGFWAAVIWDIARSAPALRLEVWRENTQTIEVIMKVPAILTMLGGVFGLVNVVVEWAAGGSGTMAHTFALLLAVFASVLLIAAGAAILRSAQGGLQAARLALFGSLGMIVAARLTHPWMSILGQLIGIGLPVALLIVLSWPRRASHVGVA